MVKFIFTLIMLLMPMMAMSHGNTTATDKEQDKKTAQKDLIIVFRHSINSNPQTSAEVLIQIVRDMDENKLNTFINKNCSNIAKVLNALEILLSSGKIEPEYFKNIMGELEKYRVIAPNQKTRGRSQQIDGTRNTAPDKKTKDAQIVPLQKNPVMDIKEVRDKLEEGNIKEAQADIEKLKTDYPENSQVQSAVAEYYNEIGKYHAAEKSATSAIELDPENISAYKARAMARINLEDRLGAVEDVKRALEIDPQDESVRVLSNLIESRKQLSSLKTLKSLEEMKKILGSVDVDEVIDDGGTIGSETGVDYFVKSSIDKENKLIGNGINYNKSRVYSKTAATKVKLADYESAVKYATLAIGVNPGALNAYLDRATAYNFLGRYDDAIKDASFVLEHDPSNVTALNIRSWALNRKGQYIQASEDATKAINLAPHLADSWVNRALSLEKAGNYTQMLDDLKQASALNSIYSAKYQDAVAQYQPKIGNYNIPGRDINSGVVSPAVVSQEVEDSKLKKFLILLAFTITGGLLIGFGFLHIVSSYRMGRTFVKEKQTHPEVLSPSIFYEGVASGKYKIERKLGEGAMGVVYEATDQTLGRKVAIKKMNDEIKTDDREKQRFLEEARTVAMLHHPNIVEIYTIFEEDNNLYLVFEYVDGITLDKMLQKEVRLSFDKCKDVFNEVSLALSYAHSKNIVHRDLKLSNIMISNEGFVKVMDFGLARRSRESFFGSSKEVVGSPAYMAPEQDLGILSKESDIFSLGVCIYEALTGVLPFEGPDFHYEKQHKIYRPVSSIVDGIGKKIDEVLSKALEPDPENRYKSIEEFRVALMNVL